MGTLYNTNTLEAFKTADKKLLLEQSANEVSCSAEMAPLRFLGSRQVHCACSGTRVYHRNSRYLEVLASLRAFFPEEIWSTLSCTKKIVRGRLPGSEVGLGVGFLQG